MKKSVILINETKKQKDGFLGMLLGTLLIRKCNAIYRIKCNMDNKNSQSLKCELNFS